MKSLLLILFLSGTSCFLRASAITAIINNGPWSTTSTWDLGRVPQTSDTIIIPAGIQIAVTGIQTMGDVAMDIHGTLMLKSSGALDLGANSVVVVAIGGQVTGTSNASERIMIGGVIKYQENVNGTFNGPGYINGGTPAFNAVGGGFQSGTMMPLMLVRFGASTGPDQTTLLYWTTASEENTCCFTLLRSRDLQKWDSLAMIVAAGNSNALLYYSYQDAHKTGSGNYYYRLRLVDQDGHYTYSSIVSFRHNSNNALTLTAWPNPLRQRTGMLAVSWNKALDGDGQLNLYTSAGKLVGRETVSPGEQAHLLPVAGLPAGLYLVQLQIGQRSYLQKVLVQ